MAVDQEDRRRAPRYDVRIAAAVAVERRIVGPCIILDINDFGARLEVGDVELPDELYLIDAVAIVGYRARVQWRKSPMIGTRFLQSWDIAALATPLWLQAMRAEAMMMLGAQRGIRLVT